MKLRRIQLFTFLVFCSFTLSTGHTDASNSASKSDPATPTSNTEDRSKELTINLSNDLFLQITKEELVKYGMRIIFGTEDPLAMLERGESPIGKGVCPLCHKMIAEQRADRAPPLIGVPDFDLMDLDQELDISIEARSHARIREERYRMYKEKYASEGEPYSSFRPHAETPGEYLIQSLYCPGCYVVYGYGLKGSAEKESLIPGDTTPTMPRINKPPIALNDFEIVAVVPALQSMHTPGDYSKITVLEDWEHYFGKKFSITKPLEEIFNEALRLKRNSESPSPPIAQTSDTPEQIVKMMTCFACHKIPGISIAGTGIIGPLLIMKTNAENRIRSPEYQQAVQSGKAHATTPKEYVIESIIDPAAFIVPGFADDMLKDFGHKFTECLGPLCRFSFNDRRRRGQRGGLGSASE